MRIVMVIAMEFVLICIKPRDSHILTHFIFATTPWARYPVIPTSDMQKLGLGGACLVLTNLYIFKIGVHHPHCTVILRMQGPDGFLLLGVAPLFSSGSATSD